MTIRWLGYSVPVQYFLFQNKEDNKKFTLKQNFGFNFEGFLAEDYTLKIILPEGATDIDVTILVNQYTY